MRYIFRIEGGLGKNFALLPTLTRLSTLNIPTTFIVYYQQVFNYFTYRDKIDFVYNWNIVIPSPYDIYHEKFVIHLLEPYSADFFLNKKHITVAYAEVLDNIINTNISKTITPDEYFDWSFDDNKILERLNHVFEVLASRDVVVLELQNRTKNPYDPRSLNLNQINEIIKHYYDKNYNIVIVSSTPYQLPYNAWYMNEIFQGSRKNCRIYYIYDVLELAVVLRWFAKEFVSIDSFLPYLAHTKYVRHNQILTGTVFFISTHPDNFGYPENRNVLLNSQPASRTFGLGSWDGFNNIKDLQLRDNIPPKTFINLLP